MIIQNDTIAAVSTPPGVGGIAVIRVSGSDAIKIVNTAWKGADLDNVKSHTLHLGRYFTSDGDLLDEAVAAVFHSPNSFTGENVVEISIHGSEWIQREILADLIKRGARIALPGEFSQRAFLNNKIDLAQAEGIADLIASSSKAAHTLAINQTKGTFSQEFNRLREKLIEFASLLELELDFSEEDVEFANRDALIQLCNQVVEKVDNLAKSYAKGAVLKNGVPVVIAGIPNAGKSSLLNILLNDDKAIVADIPGTTRDIIEDTIDINGLIYRFIDTAGLRKASETIEAIGVNRARAALEKAFMVIWVIDPFAPLENQYEEFSQFISKHPESHIIPLINKSDLSSPSLDLSSVTEKFKTINTSPIIFSTHTKQGLQSLLNALSEKTNSDNLSESDIIVTNARHYEALCKASEALHRALNSLQPQTSTHSFPDPQNNNISSEFIAQDIREAISYLSSITGIITTDTLLHSIFSRFCIGK